MDQDWLSDSVPSTMRVTGQPMPSSWLLVEIPQDAIDQFTSVRRGDVVELPYDGTVTSFRVINWEGPRTLLVEPLETTD